MAIDACLWIELQNKPFQIKFNGMKREPEYRLPSIVIRGPHSVAHERIEFLCGFQVRAGLFQKLHWHVANLLTKSAPRAGAAAGYHLSLLPCTSSPFIFRCLFQSLSRLFNRSSSMTPIFLSANKAERIDIGPNASLPPHVLQLPQEVFMFCASLIICLFSVISRQKITSSSHVISWDNHRCFRSASISGNHALCTSPDAIYVLPRSLSDLK